jgi:plasmid stabilization system protein ParE
MTLTVILRPRAEDDIRVAYQWYEAQQVGLGEDFLARLRRSLLHAAEFPESSPVIYKSVRRCVVTRFPYLAFYLSEPTRILVLAVLHTSRDPATWPHR